MNATRPLVLFVLLLGALFAGCASTTTRVENGAAFATAGIAYVDSIPAVLDESFELSVVANSLTLAIAREDLTAEDREQRLSNADDLLAQRLEILRDIKRHSSLLRSYFIALKALTASDSATGITDATKNLVQRLGELQPRIANASIGGAKPADLIGPATNLIVGLYQNAALKRELEVHGDAIERELALQRAVMETLADDMMANADLRIQIRERNPIFDAFVGAGALPADWSDRRIAALKRIVELGSIEDVEKAASNMHETWIAFVENRATGDAIDLLLQDVEALVDLARLFKSE